MPEFVLVHGGSFTGSCWDPLVDRLDAPALAVDLPGRGAHPAPLDTVTIAGAAVSVASDVDGAGFDDVVLVGHSLAGCSLPAIVGVLGDRVRHVVFVACTVPAHGTSCLDTLPEAIRDFARTELAKGNTGVLSPEQAREFFGNDLDDEQFAWMCAQMVPEAPGLLTQPVDLSPLRNGVPRTWVRPLNDAIVAPEEQLRFATNVGDCPVVDLDAGHMCMISRPDEVAALLEGVARER
jgi:pimeloyl-ACP methyl ester carboxylesterase